MRYNLDINVWQLEVRALKWGDQPYSLTETEQRALAAVAEAETIAMNPEPLWPGWEFTALPLALTAPDRQGYFLVHPGCLYPEGAKEIAEDILFVSELDLPPDQRAVVQRLGDKRIAWLPLRWVGSSRSELQEFITRICRLSFLAFFNDRVRASGSDIWDSVDDDDDDIDYERPDDIAACHALARIEAAVLADCLEERSMGELSQLMRAFCLVRRERRIYYSDADTVAEWDHEREAGMGLYMECLVLMRASSQIQKCHPVLTATSGLVHWRDARPLLRARLRGLRSSALASEFGLRKRLPYLALGMALLLDKVNPKWHEKAYRVPLERLIEEQVLYDGKEDDDATLAAVLKKYEFARKLEEERSRLRLLRQRKKKVEQHIWQSSGTLLTVDVSELPLQKRKHSDSKEEIINDHLRVHEGDSLFIAGSTRLEFSNTLVLEDREHWLLQTRTAVKNLQLVTDKGVHHSTRKAAFEEGFELELPEVRIRAQRGYVQMIQGGLYIKIER